MAPDIDNKNGVEMADIASINGQDAPSGGGGSATATPAISISGGGLGVVAGTITKAGGGTYTNPNYSISVAVGGTTTVADADVDRVLESDSSHLGNTIAFADTNAASGQRTVSVRAQEFGDTIQSSAATATFDVSYIQNKYIRVQSCTSDGTAAAYNMGFQQFYCYTGSGRTGTTYPTTTLTSNTSETGLVVDAGGYYGSYEPWKVANPSSWWWSLTASAANSWIQYEFEDGTYSTKPIIKSIRIQQFSTYLFNKHIKITGSDNADGSSPDFSQIYNVFNRASDVTGSTVWDIG